MLGRLSLLDGIRPPANWVSCGGCGRSRVRNVRTHENLFSESSGGPQLVRAAEPEPTSQAPNGTVGSKLFQSSQEASRL